MLIYSAGLQPALLAYPKVRSVPDLGIHHFRRGLTWYLTTLDADMRPLGRTKYTLAKDQLLLPASTSTGLSL
ncbi:MAG: hypothetical protein EOS09_18085 [Mesorhizobium sp.]|nr:MAG: hypothetical protein EOS09_18085 [Mesorhizobium sp.]